MKRGPGIRLILSALLLWAFGGGCVKLVSAPLLLPEKQLKPADCIVVLGFGPPVDEQGRPAKELRRRVEKGVDLYRQGLAPFIIFTGGNTYKDYYESTVMAVLAKEMGVPGSAIIEEREAMDTIGNARGSAAIMRERGWTSAILVSSPYHLKRAKMLFEKAGVQVQTAASAPPDSPVTAFFFALHEYLARFSYLFMDLDEKLKAPEEGKTPNAGFLRPGNQGELGAATGG